MVELIGAHRGVEETISQEADPKAREKVHRIIPSVKTIITVEGFAAGNPHEAEQLNAEIGPNGKMNLEDFLREIGKKRQHHPPEGRKHYQERRCRGDLVGVLDRSVDKTSQIDSEQNRTSAPGEYFFLFRLFHAFTLIPKALLLSRPMVEMPSRQIVESCKTGISLNNKDVETKDIIAENIIGLRKKKGLTQAELAAQLGFTDKAVSKWERGLSLPDAPTLQELANLFAVDVNYLFTPHTYDPLDEESEKKLHRKEIVVKLVYIGSLFLVCTILIAILLSAIADIYDETAKIRAYLFILPGLAFLALLINIAFGHNGRMNLILASLLTWALADALYYFLGHRLVLIFAIAAVLQIAIVLFPKLSAPKAKKKK